jgi:hypothetical protein
VACEHRAASRGPGAGHVPGRRRLGLRVHHPPPLVLRRTQRTRHTHAPPRHLPLGQKNGEPTIYSRTDPSTRSQGSSLAAGVSCAMAAGDPDPPPAAVPHLRDQRTARRIWEAEVEHASSGSLCSSATFQPVVYRTTAVVYRTTARVGLHIWAVRTPKSDSLALSIAAVRLHKADNGPNMLCLALDPAIERKAWTQVLLINVETRFLIGVLSPPQEGSLTLHPQGPSHQQKRGSRGENVWRLSKMSVPSFRQPR